MEKLDFIQTGDVLLMSSITPFAILVKWTLASEYNHIAVAVRIDDSRLPDIKVVKKGGRLCLIEFNGDDYQNILTDQIHHGNRLVDLDDLWSKYKKLAIMRLNPIYYNKKFEKMTEIFIMENCLSVCKMDICQPILCVLGIGENKTRETPKFCSELVSKYYQTLIPGSIQDPSKWLPSHFGRYNKDLGELFMGEEVVIKDEPHSTMDFFWSPWMVIIIFLVIIIVIYLCFKIGKN